MATNFKLKRSAVASKRPGTTDLELGELALNTYDGFLYSETTGAGSTVSLLTPWQEKYGQGSIYYTGGSVGIGSTVPTTKLDVSGGLYVSGIATVGTGLSLGDNVPASFGDSNDLEIIHESGENHFNLSANTFFKGDVAWGVRTSGNQSIIAVNGSSRFVDLYGSTNKVLSTTGVGVTVRSGLYIENAEFNMTTNGNKILDFETGGSNGVYFRHNPNGGSNSTFIKATYGGSLELYDDSVGGKVFETTGIGVSVTGLTSTTSLAVTGIATFLSAASFLDNDVLYFGGSSSTGISTDYRLRIYSDGTDSYISEATGAGDLRLSSDSRVEIRNAALDHTVASFNTGVGVTVFDRFKVSGISSFTGDVDLGDATSDTITATGRFDSDLIPSTDDARDLGSTSLRWRNLYASNIGIGTTGATIGIDIVTRNLLVNGISTFIGHADFTSVSIGSTLNVAGVSTFNDNVHLLDGDKLQLGGAPGTVDGLELYHVSNHSYIDDTGSGNLKVRSNNLRISNGGESKVYATFTPTVVDLYADNNVRLTTSGAGVTVTGIITATTGHFDSVTGPSTITIDPAAIGDNTGTVVIKGDLQVDGTTTTVNSTTLTVTDKNIEIAKGAGNDAAVDGAGITVDSTQGDKTWNWVDATDAWTSSEHIHVAAGKRIGFADDPNSYIDGDGNDSINFTTNGDERLSIDSEGKLIIGGGSSRDVGFTHRVQIEDTDSQPHGLSIISNRANQYGVHIDLAKSRGSTRGSNTIVQNNDKLANIIFRGADGTDLATPSVQIVGAVDGTPGSNNIPGRIEFYTQEAGGSIEEKLRITSTGRVGIGSTDPGYPLDVIGSIGFSGQTRGLSQSASSPTYSFNGDSDTGMYRGGGVNILSFATAGIARLQIAASGRVGIGTNLSAPSYKLDVREAVATAYAANATNAVLGVGNINSSAATNSSGIHMYSDGNGRGVVNLNCLNNSTNASADFTIQTRHSGTLAERLRITSTGNVGIGSVTPDAKLSVVGVGTFKEDVYIDKKLYVGGIEIGGPGGPGIGTDITTRHLTVTGISTFNNGAGIADFKPIQLEKSATTGATRIQFLENGTNKGGITYSHDNNRIEVQTEVNGKVRFNDVSNTQFAIISGTGLTVDATTQSSDKDTGSIIAEGGVGIEKNLNVGGVINSSTDVQINGTSVVDTALNDAVAMAIALG